VLVKLGDDPGQTLAKLICF